MQKFNYQAIQIRRNEGAITFQFSMKTIITFHSILAFFSPLLKVVLATFLLVCPVSLKESTFETRKHVFYFISRALFALEIIRF